MNIKILTGIILVLVIHSSWCQQISFKGPVAYLEVSGAAFGTYSINAEHLVFSKSNLYVNARAGYGYLKAFGDIDPRFPVGINFYSGKKNSHPEIGIYATYAIHNYIDKHISRLLYFVPSASYRFQKPGGGIFFRVSYTPVWLIKEYTDQSPWIRHGKFHQTFGLALGYYFRKKEF